MKIKKEIGLFLLILLIIPCVYCLELKLYKNTYAPRETLQAEINGNFLSLKPENILVYEQGKVHSEPNVFGLTKQNGIYYFYATLPNKEGNFSLRIENAEYIDAGVVSKNTIEKKFIIKKTNESYLSVFPGFIFTNKDFEVKVKSINSGQQINLNFDTVNKNLSLLEEVEETVKISISDTSLDEAYLNLGKYSIPVFMDREDTGSSNLIKRMAFSIKNLNGTVYAGKSYFFTIFIENTGEANLTNISLSNSLGAVVTPSSIAFLQTSSSIPVNITIKVPENKKNNLSGDIQGSFENSFLTIPVFFYITENQSSVNVGVNNSNSLSCKNIGQVCTSTQECTGQITPGFEGPCCIGACEEKETSSSTWIYGVVLLAIVLAILYYVYWKSKKRKLESPQDILRKRSDNFRKRIRGDEVSGELDTV